MEQICETQPTNQQTNQPATLLEYIYIRDNNNRIPSFNIKTLNYTVTIKNDSK